MPDVLDLVQEAGSIPIRQAVHGVDWDDATEALSDLRANGGDASGLGAYAPVTCPALEAAGRSAADQGLLEEQAHRVVGGEEEEGADALLQGGRHAGSSLGCGGAQDRMVIGGIRCFGEGDLQPQVAEQRASPPSSAEYAW